MPDFNITSPDGTKFKVTAPEGVTEDEVLRRVQSSKLPPSDPSFAQDVMAGFTAPIRGGAQLLKQIAPGATNQPSSEGVVKDAKVKQPEADENSIGYTLGSMIGPMGAAGAAAKVVPRVIGPVARGIAAGGVSGALNPVEDENNFWTQKAEQIGEGMTLGFGLGWAGKAASAGIHALGDFLVRKYPENITTQAVNGVLKRIQQDSKYGAPTAQQMFDLVEASNKPLVLADVGGKNLRSLAGRVTRSPGESRALADSFLTQRDKEASDRLSSDIDKYVFSGPTMHQTAEGLLRARSAASRPLYDAADKLQNVWSPRLQQFLDNPDVAKGMARGYRIERNMSLAENRPFDPTMMGIDLDEEGNIKLLRTPNMRVLDMGKQGLDAMIADERNPMTGRLSALGLSLERVRQAYVKELDSLDTDGVYKKAREAWQGPSAALDALRLGRSVFGNSPEENETLFGKLTQGDQEFARIGMADILRERLLKSHFNSDESRALLKSPWMVKQLQPFFGTPQDFDKFVQSVTEEGQMAQSKNDFLRGSQTAERAAEDTSSQAATLAGGARIARNLVEGRFFSAIGDMWRLRRDLKAKPDPELDEGIAKILFAPDIAKTTLGLRLIQPLQEMTGNYLKLPADKIKNILTPVLSAGAAAMLPQ